jgi:hypothetical protein
VLRETFYFLNSFKREQTASISEAVKQRRRENGYENYTIFSVGCFPVASALIVPSTIAAQDKGGMKDGKDMMKDGNDAVMKDKMKSEKKGQAGKTE